jgi:hypothetical protein
MICWKRIPDLQRHLRKRWPSTTGSSLSSIPSSQRLPVGPIKCSLCSSAVQHLRFLSNDCAISTGESTHESSHEVSTNVSTFRHSGTMMKAQLEQILNKPFWLIPKKGTGMLNFKESLRFFLIYESKTHTFLSSISSIVCTSSFQDSITF